MIVKPRIRGFICTTAHPLDCRANVDSQIATVERLGPIAAGTRIDHQGPHMWASLAAQAGGHEQQLLDIRDPGQVVQAQQFLTEPQLRQRSARSHLMMHDRTRLERKK